MVKIVLAMVLIVSICGGAMGQSGCTIGLMGMSPCLNFITGNTSTPSSSCCSQLGNVVQSQPQCLCQLLNGNGINLGLSINRTLALTLPSACNVQTPPVSQCNGKIIGHSALLCLFTNRDDKMGGSIKLYNESKVVTFRAGQNCWSD